MPEIIVCNIWKVPIPYPSHKNFQMLEFNITAVENLMLEQRSQILATSKARPNGILQPSPTSPYRYLFPKGESSWVKRLMLPLSLDFHLLVLFSAPL